MLMTVLISDARQLMKDNGAQLGNTTLVDELLYADETLLLGTEAHPIAQYMHCVARAGQVYGLSFN